jgi:hypothetical protein
MTQHLRLDIACKLPLELHPNSSKHFIWFTNYRTRVVFVSHYPSLGIYNARYRLMVERSLGREGSQISDEGWVP